MVFSFYSNLQQNKCGKILFQVLRDSKISLTTEVDDLKEQVKHLINKNGGLRNEEQRLLQEKSRILCQLEESKQMQQEAENMLMSLLKIVKIHYLSV